MVCGSFAEIQYLADQEFYVRLIPYTTWSYKKGLKVLHSLEYVKQYFQLT